MGTVSSKETSNREAENTALLRITENYSKIKEKNSKKIGSCEFSLQECVLQKFNPYLVYVPEEAKPFWLSANIFKGVEVNWALEMTFEAYNYLSSFHEDTRPIKIIANLCVGKFEVLNKTDKALSIKPITYEDIKIASWIILEDIECHKMKILVTKLNKEDFDNFIANCGQVNRKIVDMHNFSIKSLLEKDGETYIPRKLTYPLESPHYKVRMSFYNSGEPIMQENLKIFPDEEKNEAIHVNKNVKNVQKSPNILVMRYNCKSLKKAINANYIKDLSIEWIVFYLQWHYVSIQQMAGKAFHHFDLYKDLDGKYWNVAIELDFIKYLNSLPKKLCITYIYKILMLSQGFAFSDIENFYKLNPIIKDYIYIPVLLDEFELPPFCCLMCVSEGINQPSFQLRVLDLLDLNNTEKQKNAFIANMQNKPKKIMDIKSICDRDGLKSLTIIEENKRIIPIFDFKVLQDPCNSTKIFFVIYCSLTEDINSIQISFSEKRIHRKNKYFNLEILDSVKSKVQPDSKVFICRFKQANLTANLKFHLKLGEQKGISKSKPSESKSMVSSLSIQPYNFVFNVKFLPNVAEPDFIDSECVPTSILYEQYEYYVLMLMKHSKFKGFPCLISQFNKVLVDKKTGKECQIHLIKKLDSYLLKVKQKDISLEMLHSIICTFSLINISFFEDIHLKSLSDILSWFPSDFFLEIINWKKLSTYKESIIGLQKLFILCQKHDCIKIYELIPKIKDYNLQFEFLIKILKQSERWKMVLDSERISIIKQCNENFILKDQVKLMNALMICIDDLRELLLLFNDRDLLQLEEGAIKKSFKNFLLKKEMPIFKVHESASEICNNADLLTGYIDPAIFSKFFKNNLKSKQNIKIDNLFIYCSIYNLVVLHQEYQIVFDYSIVIETFNVLGYADSFVLIENFPGATVKIYSIWLSKLSRDLADNIEKIDKELIKLQNNISILNKPQNTIVELVELSIEYLLNIYQLHDVIVCINECKFKPLIIKVKNIYIERVKISKEQFNKESRKIKALHNNNQQNKTVKEIVDAVNQIYMPSQQELMDNIVVQPNDHYFLYSYIKGYKDPNYILAWSELCGFVNNITNSIINKSVLLCTLQNIEVHTISQSATFIYYIKEALASQRSKVFKTFEISLKECISELQKFKREIKLISRVFTLFCGSFDILTNHKLKFEEFQSNYLQMQLAQASMPDNITPLQILVNKAPYAAKSMLFTSMIISYKSKKIIDLREFANKFVEVERQLVKQLNDTIPKIKFLRINNFTYFTQVIDYSKIQYEIKIISKLTRLQPDVLRDFQEFMDKIYFDTQYLQFWKIFLLKDLLNLKDTAILDLAKDWINKRESYTLPEYLQKLNNLTMKFMPSGAGYYKPIIDLLECIRTHQDFIKFLNTLNQDEVDFLQYGFDTGRPNKAITHTLLLELSETWSFFAILRNLQGSLEKYFKFIIDTMRSKNYSGVIKNIQTCADKLKDIKDFIDSIINQEQASLNKIKEIYQSSLCRIFKEKNGKVVAQLYLNKKVQQKPFLLDELTELKDRAYLTKYIINEKDKREEDRSEELEIYSKFIRLVELITRIIDCIIELKNSLYNTFIKFACEFKFVNGELESAESQYNYYEKYCKEWKKSMKVAMAENYYLNFLSNKRICCLSDYVFKIDQESLEVVRPLLKFIRIEPIVNFVPPVSNNAKGNLNAISAFLKGLKHDGDTEDFVKLYAKKELTPPLQSVIICETSSFYLAIISLYFNDNRKVPKVDEVFFCHFNTEWNELKLFLNRCFFPGNTNLYTMVNPEELSQSNQNRIITKIHKLIRNRPDFVLAFITKDTNSTLVKNYLNQVEIPVKKLNNHLLLQENKLKEIIRSITKNTLVVTSEYVGLGKTTFILKEIKSSKMEYVEVNISGELTDKIIGRTLKNHQKVKPTAYHFQLNYLEDSALLQEFLFSIAIFKQYYSSKTLFYIPKGSMVFIEIANTYKNTLLKSLPFLEMLTNQHIPNFTFSGLIISHEIAYVCSYLDCYKSNAIDQTDLAFGMPIKPPETQRIISLLEEFFKSHLQNPTYHQFQTFINVLSTLFKNFEKGSFSTEVIKWQSVDFPSFAPVFASLRSSLIESMLDTTKEFTSKCVDLVKIGQNSAIDKVAHGTGDNGQLNDQQQLKMTLKWENSNHFTMLFLEQGDFLCIYRNQKMVPPNYIQFLGVQKYLEKYSGQYVAGDTKDIVMNIEDYNDFNSFQLIEKLMTFYIKFSMKDVTKANSNLRNKRSNDFNAIKESRLSQLCNSGYVLTPDNFLKMNLIYIRCIASVPIFIMGETGCGKTSLIRFFVQEILREHLEIFCIHTGITSDHIYERIKIFNEKAVSLKSERFWVFFDEFNTSDCVGMICDIICDKRVRDLKLSDNFVFLGACNPYRVKGRVNKDNVGIKLQKNNKAKSTRLVHIVKPLPDKAIEFVWDFGALQASEIKNYILSIISDIELGNKALILVLLCAAHEFFQINEDSSSVSLRDIRRFVLLFKWFKESREMRKNNPAVKFRKEIADLQANFGFLKHKDLLISGLLALFHCYFLRISSEIQRDNFFAFIEAKCKQNKTLVIEKKLIQNILKAEQYDLMARMVIPQGIAHNSALLENIFAIIPCVLNKIPILICGKPGCSKSLSIKMLESSLRGDKSSDDYFKTLPELKMVSFQGSDSCTSEGIIQVFNQAKEMINSINVLPVVIFDEIGLAEISKHNPLKVLHELLEFENCNVGFIGISNWRLDSSKMNRTLFLARPDPSESDIKETALTVYESITEKKDQEQKKMITALALAYFELKKHYSESEYSDFYGLRDFYNMIKFASAKLKEDQSNKKLLSIAHDAIFRNFGGKLQGAIELRKYFLNIYKTSARPALITPDVNLMIKQNLTEKESRYLMIICSKHVSTFLIDGFLENLLKSRRIIRGSNFDNDISKDDLRYKALSDIIRYMEQGFPIILQDMEIIYSSLYDLFNQNFMRFQNNRKYCRIALGAQFNPRCFVHENFKVIVFINDDDETIRHIDAPFLNRFEKHLVTIDNIFTSEVKSIAKTITDWIRALINSKDNSLYITSFFPLLSEDAINLTCYFFTNDVDERSIAALKWERINQIKEFWINTSTTDLALLCEESNSIQNEKKFILKTWKKLKSISFVNYIEEILRVDHEKVIIITYDSQSIDNKFNQAPHKKILIQKCCNFNCENDLKNDLRKFYENEESELYILELDFTKEQKLFTQIIALIHEIRERVDDLNRKKKNFCLLVRMYRNDNNRNPLLFLNGWKYKIFDSLLSPDLSFFEELYLQDFFTIFNRDDLINWELEWPEVVFDSIDTLKYESPDYNYEEILNHKMRLADVLIQKSEVRAFFFKKIAISIEDDYKLTKKSFVQNLLFDSRLVTKSRSARDAVKQYAKLLFTDQLIRILILCEKKVLLSSLYSIDDKNIMHLFELEIQKFELRSINAQSKYESNSITTFIKLKTPFIFEDYKNLKELYKQLLCDKGKVEGKIFKDFHQVNSPLKEVIFIFYKESKPQEEYIKDVIMIILNQSSCKLAYFEIIVAIVWKMILVNQFEEKIIKLIEIQNKVVNLYHLLEIYQDITSDNLSWAIEAINFQVTKEVDINTILQSIKSSIGYNVNESANVNEKNRLHLSIFFNLLFLRIAPSLKTIKNSDKIGPYLSSIKKFQNYFSIFSQDLNLFIKSEQQLNLCVKLCMLNLEFKILLNLCSEAMNKDKDFLSDQQFSHKILFHIDNLNRASSGLNVDENYLHQVNIKKFKIYYFDILIILSVGNLDLIVDQINLDDDLWKYSGMLIESIIEISGVKLVIKKCEEGVNNPSFIIENSRNQYFVGLSKTLERIGLYSKFSLILFDRITMMLSLEKMNASLETIKNASRNYIQHLELSTGINRNISIIVFASRLKVFLDLYSKELLLPRNVMNNKEYGFIIEMSQLIKRSNPTYELYCFKQIKVINSFDFYNLIKKLKQIRNDMMIEWQQDIDLAALCTKETIFPCVSKNYVNYIKICMNLDRIVDDINSLDEIISEAEKNPETKLLLALAFINNIYSNYKTLKFNYEPFKVWCEQKTLTISLSLTKSFWIFIRQLIYNFPSDSMLYLTPSVTETSFKQIQYILFILAISLAYNTTCNPISVLFFDLKGNIKQDLNYSFNNYFFIGAAPEKIADYLKYTLQNYNSLKSKTFFNPYSKGGSYICSNTCDYLYIIDKCGGALEIKNCPFCKQRIGGKDHKSVDREGHRNLTDNEAIEFLTKKVAWYKNNEKCGFDIFKEIILISTVRDLKQEITFSLLNSIPNVLLYWLLLSKTVDISALKNILKNNDEKKITIQVKKNIEENLKNIINIISSHESFYWIFSSISKIPELLPTFQRCPSRKSYRDEFERKFEAKVFDVGKIEAINQYKSLINLITNPSTIKEYTEELKIPREDTYKYCTLFKIVKSPSFASMSESLSVSIRKSDFSKLKMIIESYNELKNLSRFWPILNFTKKLVDILSFNISRHEAHQTSIREIISKYKIRKQFKKFLSAWEGLDIKLQNDCHTFDKIKLSEGREIAYFLLETDINSLGRFITAALKTLANIQNRFVDLSRNDEEIPISYQLLSLKKSDIIKLSINLDELSESCAIQSYNYNTGQEIFYDFDKIQSIVLEDFSKAKFINVEDLNSIQYQYELLYTRGKYSGLVTKVRSFIKQKAISNKMAQDYEKEIKTKYKQDAEAQNCYCNIYNWLEKALCSLSHVKSTKNSELFDLNQYSARQIKKDFSIHHWSFASLKLEYFISFYEFIELKCYPVVVNTIGAQFKRELNQPDATKAQFTQLVTVLNKKHKLRVDIELNNFFKRIVIRMLTANTDENFEIDEFIPNESYWNEEWIDYIDEIEEIFPKNYKLAEVYNLEKIVSQISQEMNKIDRAYN